MDQNIQGIDARRNRVSSATRCFHIALMATTACALSATAHAASSAPNILFFGNSFTQNYLPKDLPTLVRDIHLAAGKPVGTYHRRTGSGFSFQAHLENTNPTETVAYVATQVLPAGETWDFVVLQGNSTESTVSYGNPANFRVKGKAIFDIIRQDNPSAKAILYQTWARHADFPGFYPIPFADPAAMQAQVRASYRQLLADINSAYGNDSARYAGAGDAFEELGFPASIYNSDLYHANNRGELIIALTVYGAMHGPTTLALAETGALDSLATPLNLTPADISLAAATADAAGAPLGDTDLDWDVDFDDLLTLAQNYGRLSTETLKLDWFTGDFDVSGKVDFDDLLSLAQNYRGPVLQGAVGGTGFVADWQLALSLVPEPTLLGGLLVPFVLPRRR